MRSTWSFRVLAVLISAAVLASKAILAQSPALGFAAAGDNAVFVVDAPSSSSSLEALVEIARRELRDTRTPGGAIAVIDGDRVVFTSAMATRPLAIDGFLPHWDVVSAHEIEIHASADEVYRQVRALDFGQSWGVRQLFRLRGLPREALTLDGLRGIRFALLSDDPPHELVLGLVGKFWTLQGALRRTNAAEFPLFQEPGYAKAVWNFSIEERPSKSTVRLRTETRVLCLDPASRRRFRRYWTVIGPFSTWIRTEALRLVREAAERAEA
jgi:hypothetical protein